MMMRTTISTPFQRLIGTKHSFIDAMMMSDRTMQALANLVQAKLVERPTKERYVWRGHPEDHA